MGARSSWRWWSTALASAAAAAAGARSPDAVTLRNGVAMPVVSLGTATYGDKEVEEAVIEAASVGLWGIDTAFNYYNQEGVGRAVARLGRDKVFLVTKTTPCFHPQAPPRYNISDVEACKAQTRQDLQADLAQLRVDYLDLVLLHGANHFGAGACDGAAARLNAAQWEVYEEFLAQNKTRAIGVSNYCQSCLERLVSDGARVVPAVNQVKYHPGMTADPSGLMSYCESHGIVPMAYSPLSSVLGDPLLESIARDHGKTSVQVALRWIARKGYTVAVRSGTRAHLAEDVDIFSWDLSDEAAARLDGYDQHPDAPSWACSAARGVELLV